MLAPVLRATRLVGSRLSHHHGAEERRGGVEPHPVSGQVDRRQAPAVVVLVPIGPREDRDQVPRHVRRAGPPTGKRVAALGDSHLERRPVPRAPPVLEEPVLVKTYPRAHPPLLPPQEAQPAPRTSRLERQSSYQQSSRRSEMVVKLSPGDPPDVAKLKLSSSRPSVPRSPQVFPCQLFPRHVGFVNLNQRQPLKATPLRHALAFQLHQSAIFPLERSFMPVADRLLHLQRSMAPHSSALRLARSLTSSPSLTRRFSSSNAPFAIRKVGMVGLGLMGHGIAQTAAAAGFQVVALDMSDKALGAGMQRIEDSLAKVAARGVKKGALTEEAAKSQVSETLARIQPTTETEDLADCDLVIEAIVENVDVKKEFYANLGRLAKPSAILASNTSSLAISDFAGASGRADKVVGIHFFNPVQIMKLVEVVRTDETDPAVFEAAKNWVAAIGKHPVSCKDTPGFIVNRLLVPYLSQAIALYERGDASKEDIDVSMQFGAGHPMGPLTLADYVGLDTTLFILEGWVRKYPNEPAFFVPEALRQKVAEGKLGRKTGEGFYKWDGDKRL